MDGDNAEKLLLQMQLGHNTLDEPYQQVKLLKASILQAGENLKVSIDNYDVGMVNTLDMLKAQAIVQSSNDNLTSSRSSYRIAKAKY